MVERGRSNPPFLFQSVTEKDLPTIPTLIQPLIILIVNDISVELLLIGLKSNEV